MMTRFALALFGLLLATTVVVGLDLLFARMLPPLEAKLLVDCGGYRPYDNDLPDPYILYRPRSNIRGKECTTNAQGFRGAPELSAVPRGRRVFVIGGSTVWGIGVTAERFTIAAQMQASLASAKEPWEVINAGVSGYNTHQLFVLIHRYLLPLHPTDIVVFDGLNDLQYAADANWSELNDHKRYRAISRLLDPVPPLAQRFRSTLGSIRTIGSSLLAKSSFGRYQALQEQLSIAPGSGFTDPYLKIPDAAIERTVALYEDMLALTQPKGVRLRLFVQPILGTSTHQPASEFERQLLTKLSQSGDWLPVLRDAYPRLEEKMRRFASQHPSTVTFLREVFADFDEQAYVDPAHYSDRGNGVLAHAIVAKLTLQSDPSNQ